MTSPWPESRVRYSHASPHYPHSSVQEHQRAKLSSASGFCRAVPLAGMHSLLPFTQMALLPCGSVQCSLCRAVPWSPLAQASLTHHIFCIYSLHITYTNLSLPICIQVSAPLYCAHCTPKHSSVLVCSIPICTTPHNALVCDRASLKPWGARTLRQRPGKHSHLDFRDQVPRATGSLLGLGCPS